MKKKNLIRKYSVQKVADLLYAEKNPEVLSLYASHVKEKIDPLSQKKIKLLKQLDHARNRTLNFIRQMNV